jgi:hypothetical protein
MSEFVVKFEKAFTSGRIWVDRTKNLFGPDWFIEGYNVISTSVLAASSSFVELVTPSVLQNLFLTNKNHIAPFIDAAQKWLIQCHSSYGYLLLAFKPMARNEGITAVANITLLYMTLSSWKNNIFNSEPLSVLECFYICHEHQDTLVCDFIAWLAEQDSHEDILKYLKDGVNDFSTKFPLMWQDLLNTYSFFSK